MEVSDILEKSKIDILCEYIKNHIHEDIAKDFYIKYSNNYDHIQFESGKYLFEVYNEKEHLDYLKNLVSDHVYNIANNLQKSNFSSLDNYIDWEYMIDDILRKTITADEYDIVKFCGKFDNYCIYKF